MKNNNLLILVPARSGSKGIKDKNICLWKGKPLIMHTINYLQRENFQFNQIIISTDSREYLSKFLDYGIPESSLLLRPSCLAEDNVVDYPVALHAWSYFENKNNKKIKYIALLRPSSPSRPKNLIQEGIKILDKDLSITSIRAMRKTSEHPYRIWEKLDNNYVKPLMDKNREPGNIPRQLLENKYFFQSGELEIFRRSTLQAGSICGDNVGILEINQVNPDIDTINDL